METSVYDAGGNLRRRQPATNAWVDFYYDAADREIAEIRHNGTLETYVSTPTVVGLVINAADQDLAGILRSMVNSVEVVFNQAVTLDAGAFTIGVHAGVTDYGGVSPSANAPTLGWSTTDGGISWMVTFSGTYTSFGSVLDGVYDLTTVASKVHGGGTTMQGGDRIDVIARVFGDDDGGDGSGSATVSADELTDFGAALYASTGDANYIRAFDVDGDGIISDNNDEVEFDARYSTHWSWWTGSTTVVAFTATQYNADGQPTSIITGDMELNNVAEFNYTYDANGRVSTETRNGNVDATTTYTYDDGNQLLAEQAGSSSTTTYTYDAAGNRTALDSSDDDDDRSYTPTTGNQYTADGTWDDSYDDEGNLTEKDSTVSPVVWLYGYDQRNQMTRADRKSDGTNIDLTVLYTYDAWGNRVTESVDADGAGGGAAVVTKFALDGWNPAKGSGVGLENFDVLADMTSGGSLTTRYLRGDKVDQILGVDDTTLGRLWYLTDRLGSVRTIVSNYWGGTIPDVINYDAYGNITSETNSYYRGRYAWTGRELDVETGLQYNRGRYYDSVAGRWTSQDPLGFSAGDSNLYRYVNNAPTNHTDPNGLQDVEIGGIPLLGTSKKQFDLFMGTVGIKASGLTDGVLRAFGKNQEF